MRLMIGQTKAVGLHQSGGKLICTASPELDYLEIGSTNPTEWAALTGDGDQIGSSSGFFGDMSPICHWVYPGFDDYVAGDLVTVELAADHALGIESVTFYANNGPGKTLTSKNYNGHFQVSFIATGGTIELRAVITPRIRGLRRVMQGSESVSSSWGTDTTKAFGNGVRSFVVFGDRTVASASVSTVAEMYSEIVSATGPKTISLASGTYDLSSGSGSTFNSTADGWITIKPQPEANVTVTCSSTSGSPTIPGAYLLRWKNINFYLDGGDLTVTEPNYVSTRWPSLVAYSTCKLWVDGCTLTGDIQYDSETGIPSNTFGASPFFRDTAHKWVTNCSLDGLGEGSPIRGAQDSYTGIVNCTVSNASDDVLTNASFVTNVLIENLNGLGTSYHTDTYQMYINTGKTYSDILINKLDAWATNEGSGQGFFYSGDNAAGFNGIVVRDSFLANQVGGVKLEFGKNGLVKPVKNIAFIDCVLSPVGSRWYNDTIPEDGLQDISNNGSCVFKNCVSTTDRTSGTWATSPFLPGQGVDTTRTSPKRAYAIDLIDGDVVTNSPYWSPYNVHLVGPDGVFASTQSNGQNDGATGVYAEYNTLSTGYTGTWLTTDNPPSDYDMDYAWKVPTTEAPYITYGIEAVGLERSGNRIVFTFIDTQDRSTWQSANQGTIVLDTTDPNIQAFAVPSLLTNVGIRSARNIPSAEEQQLIANWIATLDSGYTVKITPPA